MVRTTRITGGLLSPYKGLLPASLLRGTEIYSTCITCPTARKRAICCSNESIPIIGRLLLAARFARRLKLKLFYGAPPPAEPVVSVTNDKQDQGDTLVLLFHCLHNRSNLPTLTMIWATRRSYQVVKRKTVAVRSFHRFYTN